VGGARRGGFEESTHTRQTGADDADVTLDVEPDPGVDNGP